MTDNAVMTTAQAGSAGPDPAGPGSASRRPQGTGLKGREAEDLGPAGVSTDEPGRPTLLGLFRAPGRQHLWILAGVWAVAFLVLALLRWTPAASIGFFLVFPALWLAHERRSTGIAATLVFSAGIALVVRLGQGAPWGDALLNGALAGSVSLLMGLWFWRVYEVSQQRQEALEREREARAALRAAQDELVAAERESARAAERAQWSRDIHDTLAQGFVSVITLTQAADGELSRGDTAAVAARLAQLEEIARANLAEARSLVAGEGPSMLRSGTLGSALGRLAEAQSRDGRTAELDLDALPAVLPREVEVAALRIVQEALSNVARHAPASAVRVAVAAEAGPVGRELVIAVEDDGAGTRGAPEGTGLTGLRSRVEALGGTVTIDPAHAPDASGSTGTVLEARIPL